VRVRPRVAALVVASLTAAALAAPAAAAEPDGAGSPQVSLRAAITTGDSAYRTLPRGVLRRSPGGASLRATDAPRDSTGPTRRAYLTASPVSVINVTYREQGSVWSDQARAAFEAAVQVWERTIESSVPIEIDAVAMRFSDPSILGGASPEDFLRDDKGTATLADDVFEPVALANARRGTDRLPGSPDLVAEFDPTARDFYFGLDGNPPAEQYDFRTVVLHEIGHGLGLIGSAYITAGRATVGDPDDDPRTPRQPVSYDEFTYAAADDAGNGGKRILAMADGSQELKTALTGNRLFWAGQLARTAAGGGKVKLYAPSTFFEGTSYGHLDENTYPGEDVNGLMTAFVDTGESFTDVGQIAMGMLADMGFPVPALRGARFTALDPVRALDTREQVGTTRTRPLGAGEVLDLQVAGSNGVPADATAVVLNVTGVAPSATTDVRVYPTPVVASPVPEVSNLNLVRGITRANLVTVPVGNNGQVRLRNAAGEVQLLADLAGYYAPAAASTFSPADPVRILDTRFAVGTDRTTPVGSEELLDLAVTSGSSPVPAGATAVALTVTAVGATASTDVRVYPTPADASGPPVVSNINVRPGVAVPNVVVVKLGQDGRVRLRNAAGNVHLLADVNGWYDAAEGGTLFRPVNPSRILDTRSRLGTSPTAPTSVGPGESIVLRVGGKAQVPSLAQAAVLNVTGVGATATTDVRVYPATATSPPEVSNLNLAAGQTAADLVVVRLGNRSVRLRNSGGRVGLLADVAGWFGPAS
jgi:hypothetical protein